MPRKAGQSTPQPVEQAAQPTRRPSRFHQDLAEQRYAKGTRPVYRHGQIVYVPRKGTHE